LITKLNEDVPGRLMKMPVPFMTEKLFTEMIKTQRHLIDKIILCSKLYQKNMQMILIYIGQ